MTDATETVLAGLYNHPTSPVPVQPPAAQPTGSAVYDHPTSQPASEADPGRLYDAAAMWEPAIGPGLDRLAREAGLAPAERRQYLEQAAAWSAELGLSEGDVTRLHNLIVSGLIETPEPAQVRAWADKAERDNIYGMGSRAEYQTRLGLVQGYLARRPQLARLLEESGAGNHPDVVHALLQRAYSLPK